jgi:alanyl-tRNA synthetase
MQTQQIIDTFREFFGDRGHRWLPDGTLIPSPGDPVLFTTSGMHPLTPHLEGHPHPQGRRLSSVQRCLRTTDLDEVGDPSHVTVFQMLGSWSLGDYPGPQSLRWGLELLRDGYGIDPQRLHVTVFGGDDQLGPDTGSLEIWHELGVPVELTRDGNWWSNGPTGPCGPDSEIFVWTGDTPPQGTPTTDDRWMELWNHVMMCYRRHHDGRLEPLTQPNVDTGMGLERLVMVLQGRESVYDCDLFQPWTGPIGRLWSLDPTSTRVVCDHLRSSVVVIGDGVLPSNTGRGYVLRRLIRRTLTTLWRDEPSRSLGEVPTGSLESTVEHFGQTIGVERVRRVLLEEEGRFIRLVSDGRRVVSRLRSRGPLTERDYEYLRDTHGLPRDLVETLSIMN